MSDPEPTIVLIVPAANAAAKRRHTSRADIVTGTVDWGCPSAGERFPCRPIRPTAGSPTVSDDKNPVENAFTPDQIAFLGPGLSKALRRTHPDEFVVFGFSRPRPPQLTEITTGGWFVEGEQLHLVLANYRQVVSMSHIRDQLWNNPLRPNAGPSYDIVPGAYQSIDQARGIVSLVSAESPDLAINYQALLAAKPTLQAPPPAATAPAVEDRPELSLEEKLITLKTLKERGLITEGEYQEKKKQLLDKF